MIEGGERQSSAHRITQAGANLGQKMRAHDCEREERRGRAQSARSGAEAGRGKGSRSGRGAEALPSCFWRSESAMAVAPARQQRSRGRATQSGAEQAAIGNGLALNNSNARLLPYFASGVLPRRVPPRVRRARRPGQTSQSVWVSFSYPPYAPAFGG